MRLIINKLKLVLQSKWKDKYKIDKIYFESSLPLKSEVLKIL